MPVLSENNKAIFVELKAAYNNLPWYRKILPSRSLAVEINNMDDSNPSLQSAFNTHRAFVSQPWFLNPLAAFAHTPFNQALQILQQIGLLSGPHAQANFNAIAKHSQLDWAVKTLKALQAAGLLSGTWAQANFDAVVNNSNIGGVANALLILHAAGFLSKHDAQTMRDAVAAHPNPSGVTNVLRVLHKAGFLSGINAQAYFDSVIQHPNLYGLASILQVLLSAGLLSGADSEANLTAALEHRAPYGLASAFQLTHALSANTQAQFDTLISYSAILFSEDTHPLWSQISRDIFTETNGNRIFQICRANQNTPAMGQIHLARYINQEVLQLDPTKPQAFNTRQSTHVASVHQTVSESALRLQHRYGHHIADLESKLKIIETWVNAQEQRAIEQRAIQQLIHSPYDFVDPASKITTKMLIALSWEAIHDDPMRAGNLTSAKVLFLQGLFDIQRAYNLSDTFEDRDEADKTACASGTFNKFIEKLVGVHPDAELKYITKRGAMLKLIPLIRLEATLYLNRANYHVLYNLTVASLKEKIQPRVREQLLFEYGASVEALAKNYDTFEKLKKSDDYALFQAALQQEQDEGLELMIEAKLLTPDKELDQELTDWIAAINTKNTKPKTYQALRETRLKFFDSGRDEYTHDGQAPEQEMNINY
ncbi:MAG: hypothetical protein P1U36_07755 [Legionellaceae bacterium]|nr:hypothetical protein [Legionellaceae bacterium]